MQAQGVERRPSHAHLLQTLPAPRARPQLSAGRAAGAPQASDRVPRAPDGARKGGSGRPKAGACGHPACEPPHPAHQDTPNPPVGRHISSTASRHAAPRWGAKTHARPPPLPLPLPPLLSRHGLGRRRRGVCLRACLRERFLRSRSWGILEDPGWSGRRARNPLTNLVFSEVGGERYYGSWGTLLRELGNVTTGVGWRYRGGLPISHFPAAYSLTFQPRAASSASALRAAWRRFLSVLGLWDGSGQM
jgi:hypothetical protein